MYLHTYMHALTTVYTYIYMYLLIFPHICTYNCMFLHAYIYLRMYKLTYIYIHVYALTIRTWCIDLYFITGSKEKLLSYVKFKRILLDKRTGADPTPIEAMAQPLMSSPTEDPVQSSGGRFSLQILLFIFC